MNPRMGSGFYLVSGLVLFHLFLRVGLGFGTETPDLCVMAVLLGSRSLSVPAASALGFALGVLEDAFATASFGASVFAMTLVGAVGAKVCSRYDSATLRFLTMYFLVGKWTRDLLAWVVSDAAARSPFVEQMFIASPLMALYAAAAGVAARLLFASAFREA